MICVEHKGKFLANSIIKYITNHDFVIFGEYGITHDNLTTTGKYDNANIFNLINLFDIDCFLFVSVFEETYSYALSIALNTGLPIMYNNIGAYTERLENRKNCFPFEENNYHEIKNILIAI